MYLNSSKDLLLFKKCAVVKPYLSCKVLGFHTTPGSYIFRKTVVNASAIIKINNVVKNIIYSYLKKNICICYH